MAAYVVFDVEIRNAERYQDFPSMQAWEDFYNGPVYRGLKVIRDECSSARLVSVEGL